MAGAASLALLAAHAPQARAADAVGVEEIIVTAQKRAENVQTIPVAVSVVNAATLASAGVTNAESLQQVVPSLTFKRGTTNLNSTLSIRGVGTQSFASGAEPSVSVVVDGVVLGRAGMAFSEFTDISRIEVLRGPQGTLFGKNASAGVVSIVTKDPTPTFEGQVAFGYFEGNEKRANVDLSGPLGEKAGFKLSGVFSEYDGNALNVYGNKKVNGFRRSGVRGKFVGNLTDDLKLTVAADYVHAHDNCCADIIGTYIPNAQFTNIFLPALAPVVPGPTNMNVKNDLYPFTLDTNSGISAQIDWTVSDFTITSVSAYRNWKNTQVRDGDFHASYGNYVAGMDLLQHDVGGLTFRQYSQELRVASPTGQTLEYVVGAFFWHTSEDDTFTRSVNQCTASTLPADATGFQPCRPGASTYLVTSGPAAWTTKFNNDAVFGQATLHLGDNARLVAGGRWIHDKVSYNHSRTNSPTTGPGIGAPFSNADSISKDGWSAKAGGQYDFTDHVMGYATYTRGYKGPAFNVFYNMAAANTTPIAPEKSDAFEVGVKSRLFDGQLVLNLAAYTEKFKGFQANSFVLLNGAVITNLTSAGDVRSQGFEAEFIFKPSTDVSLSGGYTYNDGKILQYNCPSSLSAAQLVTCQSHNGQPLPFAPKHKLTLTGDWLLPFSAELPVDVHLGSSFVYTSLTNFDIDQTPLARQPGYGLWNASVAFNTKDERYSLTVLVKNITNKFYTAFVTPVGNGVAAGSYTRLQVPRDAQRYVGATISAKF
jgi:iron complex outermembrane receptor protein